MAKYVMISRYGNEIKKVDSERKRDELKSLGYREIKSKTIEKSTDSSKDGNKTKKLNKNEESITQ